MIYFSLVLTIGLVLVAAVIVSIYESWATKRYETIRVPDGEVTPFCKLYEEGTLIGTMVAYRTTEPIPPWRLHEEFEERIDEMHGTKPMHIVITTEPGYNSYIVFRKNLRLFDTSFESWSHSPFHLIIMPIELMIRFVVLPIQIMLDLVSHDRRTTIGFLPIGGSNPPKEVFDGISFVEGMNDIFVNVKTSRNGYEFVLQDPLDETLTTKEISIDDAGDASTDLYGSGLYDM